VAKYNPFIYVAETFQSLIKKGFLWDTIGYALLATLIMVY